MGKMQPDESYITIHNNEALIKDFLHEVIYSQRAIMHRWSVITNQTPNLKIGYPGQHLASLITGVKGTGTGARGDDLEDKSEVKSCSRVDQSDKCEDCGNNVLRSQTECPHCKSKNIKRNNDSKWLIAIRNDTELDMYVNKIPRMIFILSDYPEFESGNFEKIQFTAYEIWNQSERAENFREILKNYYEKIYMPKFNSSASNRGSIAPLNFWPYKYNFYMSNPIKTFHATIDFSKNENPVDIDFYVQPEVDRSTLPSEPMPVDLLSKDDKKLLGLKAINDKAFLTEEERKMLSLREMKGLTMKDKYHRFN